MLLKFPTDATDDVIVTRVIPVELTVGKPASFNRETTTLLYDWWSASTGFGPTSIFSWVGLPTGLLVAMVAKSERSPGDEIVTSALPTT
ncbi:MAG: hypothetical protein JRN24_03505, partial [Nitrososphaerota archaeon]|nr:hypothetical protein [Nitrososphaerota archaeon]